MSGIRRRLIDWSQPALPSAVAWLLGEAPDGDLSGMVVVVPGGRAGRRLLELLVQRAQADGVGLSPPQIVTMGRLPELLYPPQRPFADELTQRLAWVAALRQVPRNVITPFIPSLGEQRDVARLLEVADVLRSQHTELAADGLDFEHVARLTGDIGETQESRRWQAFRRVQRKYLDTLDGLGLWDKQTARLVAIRHRECHTDKRIVLVGTVDMNQAARHMLDQVAEHVTALIFAPQKLHGHFDDHGCLKPQAWATTPVPLADDRLHPADDPVDQADEAARAIAKFDGRYSADEITVGVCDEGVVPQIQRQLQQCGIAARWGPGESVAASPPCRLLEAVADLLERGLWSDFAALVRHPDVEAWLAHQPGVEGDWLTQLDRYQSRHVPMRPGSWLGEPDKCARIRSVYEAVERLTADLAGGARNLGQWTAPVVELLKTVYAHRLLDPQSPADRLVRKGLESLHERLLAQRQLPASLETKVAAPVALRWTLESVADDNAAPLPDPGAVELLGWLELALDDAPALVVTTLNEGLVPKSSTGDLFLPDGLRSRLGLDDNARRYARDCYALNVLVASRDARFVVGRRDADGYPLAPSRLLLACDDATLVRRATAFFSPPVSIARKPPLAGALTTTRIRSTFDVPRPQPLAKPIRRMRVTRFRDYLACPYRFYLRHVQRVEEVADAANELDGGLFGELAHDVLNLFGRDDRRHTSSVEEIELLLGELLNELVRGQLGTQPRPAVAVQIEQLRRRLEKFAEIQAQRAAQGWRIVYSEASIDGETCSLDVDGQPFYLTGRIDRIDFHEANRQWAIWDYKTGDTAQRPTKTHCKKNEWIDLQLPLYRYLAAEVEPDVKSILEIDGRIQLGYVQLPKSIEGVRFDPAPWTLAELENAYECAARVVRGIREQAFWPPVVPAPKYSDDLAGICMDNVFGRPAFLPLPPGEGRGEGELEKSQIG